MPAVRETTALTAREKALWAAAYDLSEQDVCALRDAMVDRTSAATAHAVTKSGGPLGIGENHCPIPWPRPKYAAARRGYLVGGSKSRLADAPSDPEDAPPARGDRDCGSRLHSYGAGPYWM
jgi:hypothetical protein